MIAEMGDQPTLKGDDRQRLALLSEIARTINSSLDLDEVLNRAMDKVLEITGAERGFLMLRDPGSEELVFRVARNIERETIQAPEFQVSRGILAQVAQEGQPLLTSNAQKDERLMGRGSVLELGLRSVLCVPIRARDEPMGLIYVDNPYQEGIFAQEDLELLSSLANQAAVAIANAQQYQELQRLYGEAKEKERLEQELRMAYAIQTSLLPEACPYIPGWEVAAHWHPARQIGGDFYDFIPLDQGKFGILIGDVSDKGAPAALFMALARSLLWAAAVEGLPPTEVLSRANRQIAANARSGMFVTAFYGILDPSALSMTYSNAGHPPPLVLRSASLGVEALAAEGMALGVMEELDFQERDSTFDRGDRMLLYTDGITEAQDGHGREFGAQGLENYLHQKREASADQLLHHLLAAVLEFVGEAAQLDDYTVVALHYRGTRA